MKILVVGGGSGGHITPALAVVREVLKEKPRTKIEFWTDRKYYKNVVKNTTEIGVRWGREDKDNNSRNSHYIRVRKLFAGKFHRYAGWSFKDYFINWQITLKDLIWGNLCGLCGFLAGLIQSFFRLMGKGNRPDVIFLKGGFVSLPVGLIARLFKIPYVIHESDAVPGLANRILMKKAKVVALGMEGIKSDLDNTVVTGIPVAGEFAPVSDNKQKALKKTLGFDPEKPLLMITGGSQGSENINTAVREILPELLKITSVGLVAGRKHYDSMTDLKRYETWDNAKLISNFRLWNFSPVMSELLGAADIVISRAGATTIAELAALRKTVILVPFERLPGGHQVKNAERLVASDAVIMVRDDEMRNQSGLLFEAAKHLLRSPKKREILAKNLHKINNPRAAKELAGIIIDVASDTYIPKTSNKEKLDKDDEADEKR